MAKKEYAFTIELPEFDEKAAYNPERPISSLIRAQVLHLHFVENLHLPERHRTNININELHTESDASEYVQKVTDLLHRHGRAASRKAATSKKNERRKNDVKRARKVSGKGGRGSKVQKIRSSAKNKSK
jgi:hypothetical protein